MHQVVHLPQEVHAAPLVRLAPGGGLRALEERLVAVGEHPLEGLQGVGPDLAEEQVLFFLGWVGVGGIVCWC